MTTDALSKALAAHKQTMKDFEDLCAEARSSPVSMKEFVRNRIEFMAACETLYAAMFYSVADSGVQILRSTGKISDINASKKP